MKYKFFAIVSIFWLLIGCQKDYEENNSSNFIVTDANTLHFKKDGETKYIVVTASSSANWIIDKTSYASWIQAEKDGNKIKVIAEKHNGSAERSTKLTISIPDGKKSFVITQFGSDPVLKLKETETDFLFKKEGDSTVLNIISNSNDWSVKTLGDVAWLTWVKDTAQNTLSLNLKEFKKGDPGYTTNRKTSLFISNGTKHLMLNITQKGWAQFGMPIYKWNNTRAAIIAAEEERGHKRSIEYDKRFYPQGEEGDKDYMGYLTDGEQTALAVYGFPYYPDLERASNTVYLKAYEKKTFDMKDLDAWMLDENKFKKGKGIPEYSDITSDCIYYLDKENVTSVFKVYNNAEARLHTFDYPGAYMSYTETSNYMALNDDNQMIIFPIRNLYMLHNPAYKLQQIIEYEKSQGMVPDYSHASTVKCTKNNNVEYESLVFKSTVLNQKAGDVVNVIYLFNYPEAIDPVTGAAPEDVSIDPKLEGTAGRRYDFYKGSEIYDWYNAKTLAENKGFIMGRRDFFTGLTAFVRGDDEIVYVGSDSEDDILILNFFKNKNLVDIVYEEVFNN